MVPDLLIKSLKSGNLPRHSTIFFQHNEILISLGFLTKQANAKNSRSK